jgi:DsbE subfamily thiol:disulfide oxidoreductase
MKWRYFVIAVILIGISFLNFHNSFPSQVFAKEAPVVGGTVPDFTLPDLNGKPVDLQKVVKNNKVTLVNFWATWCPPCRAEIPEFVKFYHKYTGKRLEIIAVNLQESTADVKNFAKNNGMNFPIVTDSSGKVGELYQVSAIPTTFFIDRNGKIFYRIEGTTDLKTLEAKVRPFLED